MVQLIKIPQSFHKTSLFISEKRRQFHFVQNFNDGDWNRNPEACVIWLTFKSSECRINYRTAGEDEIKMECPKCRLNNNCPISNAAKATFMAKNENQIEIIIPDELALTPKEKATLEEAGVQL